MTKTNNRIRVQQLIETGNYTKKEIAEELDLTVASVSSNMTYLRWGGNFIIWNEDKKLSFTDEAGFDAWEAAKKSSRKGAVSKLTAQERFDKLTKTIASQTKTLSKWEAKAEALADDPQEDETLLPEAEAQVVLFGIKVARNQAALDAIDMSDVKSGDDPVDEELIEEELI